MRASPRQIDPQASFESLVGWIEKTARAQSAPGAIVGISGTDSILVFLACAEAFKRMGKADRVIGVHYGAPDNPAADAKGGFSCVSAEFNWVAKEIFPWLAKKAPEARLEVNHAEGHDNDNIRWGRLLARAVSDIGAAQSAAGNFYFPIGTRNATEDYLGTYSQISKAVSMQPIVGLYKSEVLQICKYLDVPQVAMTQSRVVDCACGRFDTAAEHLDEVDAFIMKEKGELSKDYIKGWDRELRARVMEYVLEERERNVFRTQTPYRPDHDLTVAIEPNT